MNMDTRVDTQCPTQVMRRPRATGIQAQPLPTQLGHYRIESMLGKGGFGRVYRAIDEDGGVVALKVSHGRPREQSTLELTLQSNEIEAMRRLRHPSVVEVIEHGLLDSGELYIAMELCEGPTLRTLLGRRKRFDVVEALRIAGRWPMRWRTATSMACCTST